MARPRREVVVAGREVRARTRERVVDDMDNIILELFL